MGMNGLCLSGFFGSILSVFILFLRIGVRGGSGDGVLFVVVLIKSVEVGLIVDFVFIGVCKRYIKGDGVEDSFMRRG